ncbi:hypothetical protein VTN96DRAFT_2843 [Rasamsonia emersonii]|uniref:Amino acid transporter n=1 Tax=Rasamsonia emersonii (strain ATCC 16479 / CBS 393.64 / IMI 116815) TaxID=1408163 RepID=A0A0F4Z485_RASE3|nr:amino acid transporter [Rasamsonia emersonii CBS 393.64]KKA25344.1 amino acid transporter [Rasamsonia emersonii CBS 393.64]
MHGFPRISRQFHGEGISTAASPLLSTFSEITCRTPTTPRTQHHNEGNSNNTQRNYHPAASILSTLTPRDDDSDLHRHKRVFACPSLHSGADSTDSDEPRSSDKHIWARSPLTPCFLASEAPYTPDDSNDGAKLGTLSAINIIVGKTVGVGVYSVPSSIFAGVGSVGMSIMMWVLGALISFCGLAVYLDLGTAIPRSGGERVYLERIFRKPYMLSTCMFLAYVVLLGFSAPNCIILGEYAVYIIGGTPNGWNARSIGVGVITLSCLIHARAPKLGLKVINILGVAKIIIMIAFVILGFASLFRGQESKQYGQVSQTTAERNFASIWAGSSTQPYDYATALLKVIYCFRGYSAANQVLSDVKNPKKTLRLAAPIALGLVSVGYVLVNVAYFLVVDKEDFKASGVAVGAHFFRNVFGKLVGERVLPCLIVLSAFGNIAATSFAQARVNQELGCDGLLPFPSLWHIGQKTEKAPPLAGLFLHWLVSVIVILIPSGDVYAFLVDVGGYPVSVISVAVAGGLLYLHRSSRADWAASAIHYKARTTYVVIFIAANAVLLVLPWVPPVDGKGDGSLPYYAYPMTGLAILALGGIYWVWWRWGMRVRTQTIPRLRAAMAPRTHRHQQAKNFDEVEIPLMGLLSEENSDQEANIDVEVGG